MQDSRSVNKRVRYCQIILLTASAARKEEIMKDSKNIKNRNNEKLDEQTPSPAVPNRAHTEMKSETKNEKSKGAESCRKQNSK